MLSDKKISIIIPAYNVDEFIEECLDSVINQKYLSSYSYEILVGVDGCNETKNRVLEIKDTYEFLKVFWFPKNVGPYIVRNTLAYKAIHNNLIFFDADDLMCDVFVSNITENLKTHHVVRFMYSNFGEGSWAGKRSREPASGVFGIRADVFKELGGFVKFRVACDDEFRNRVQRLYSTYNIMDKDLFFRRRHTKSLTGNPATKQGSVYRADVSRKINTLACRGAKKIDPVFGEYILL